MPSSPGAGQSCGSFGEMGKRKEKKGKRRNGLLWFTIAFAAILAGLCFWLHLGPGRYSWQGARLALVGVLPFALAATLLVPFVWALGARRRFKDWVMPILLAFLMVFYSLPWLLSQSTVPTAYEPMALMVIAVMAWALGLGGFLFATRKMKVNKHLDRPVYGRFRAWQVALLCYGVAMASIFPLAWWNPTVRHRSFDYHVQEVQKIPGVAPGDSCELDVGWFAARREDLCWVRLWCNAKLLYGGYKKGVIECKVSVDGLHFSGSDKENDADPKLRIDTKNYLLQLAYDSDLDREPALVATRKLETGR